MTVEYRTVHHIGGRVERIVTGYRPDPIEFKIEAWRVGDLKSADVEAFMDLITSRASIYGVPTKLVKGRWVITRGAVQAKPVEDGGLWVTWVP